jgi:asparagine synthase (glutamine-hydrolysing)
MRRIAGVFDPDGAAGRSRVASAIVGAPSSMLELGALQVAFTGPPPQSQLGLCLFDGFLDNAAELALALGDRALDERRELSNEELLWSGYRRWGRALVARLRGDFLLLIWDRERQEGLLARDQLGVRCAYLHDGMGRLHFAGEMHDLLGLLPSRPSPDLASVAHWVAVSNRPGTATLFEKVRRLNPGSMLLLEHRGVRERPYWQPQFSESASTPRAQLLAELRGGIDRAVRRRLVPDGITGVLMSGGLDSASVAAVASEQATAGLRAYAGVFPEHPAVDEAALIRELRDRLGLAGQTAQVRSGGLLASVLESVAAWGVPPPAWGDFWTVPLLRAAASDGARVVLGGDGGDELFAPRAYLLADSLRAGHLSHVLALAGELPGADERPPRRAVAGVVAKFAVLGALPYALQSAMWRPLHARQAPGWLRGATARALSESDDPFAWKRMRGPRWWAHAAHGLTRGVEEAGVFEHHRRRAGLADLHARHPLFDLDLLELVLRSEPQASLDPHRNRPLLRASMAGSLPDSVRLRATKAWFDSLIVDCLARDDGTAVRALLSGRDCELRAYVEQNAMQRALFDRPGTASAPFAWMHQVWRLLTAECWLRAENQPTASASLGALGPSPARVVLDQSP